MRADLQFRCINDMMQTGRVQNASLLIEESPVDDVLLSAVVCRLERFGHF